MIIGHGMLAQEFSRYALNDKIVLFASGVSNSNATCLDEFNREKTLLLNSIAQVKGQKLIYFSTCSMYDHYFENNSYTLHKLNMEEILKNSGIDYIIFRLPQVLGCNNKFQLMGFLFDKIKTGQFFELYDIERNIIDISDVVIIVDYILNSKNVSNNIINIANPYNVKVTDLVKKIEGIYNWRGHYTIVSKEGSFDINIKDIEPVILKLNLTFKDYIDRKIRNYYG